MAPRRAAAVGARAGAAAHGVPLLDARGDHAARRGGLRQPQARLGHLRHAPAAAGERPRAQLRRFGADRDDRSGAGDGRGDRDGRAGAAGRGRGARPGRRRAGERAAPRPHRGRAPGGRLVGLVPDRAPGPGGAAARRLDVRRARRSRAGGRARRGVSDAAQRRRRARPPARCPPRDVAAHHRPGRQHGRRRGRALLARAPRGRRVHVQRVAARPRRGRGGGAERPGRRGRRRRLAGHVRPGAHARWDAGRLPVRAAQAELPARRLGRAGPGGVDGRARDGAVGAAPRRARGARAVVRLPARRPGGGVRRRLRRYGRR